MCLAVLQAYLDAGTSLLSLNYRYVTQAIVVGVRPPVQWPLHDAARALQFVRTHTATFGVKLQETCRSVGVGCALVYPGAPGVPHPMLSQYLTEKPPRKK